MYFIVTHILNKSIYLYHICSSPPSSPFWSISYLPSLPIPAVHFPRILLSSWQVSHESQLNMAYSIAVWLSIYPCFMAGQGDSEWGEGSQKSVKESKQSLLELCRFVILWNNNIENSGCLWYIFLLLIKRL